MEANFKLHMWKMNWKFKELGITVNCSEQELSEVRRGMEKLSLITLAREGEGGVEVGAAFGNLVEDWEERNVPWTDQLDIGVPRIEKDMKILSMGEETRLTLREGKSETGSLELGTEPVGWESTGLDRRRVALKKTLTPTDENHHPSVVSPRLDPETLKSMWWAVSLAKGILGKKICLRLEKA